MGAKVSKIKQTKIADITVQDGGSIILLRPNTEAGENWLDENTADATRLGNAVAAEPRYVPAIIEGMINDGLKVAKE